MCSCRRRFQRSTPNRALVVRNCRCGMEQRISLIIYMQLVIMIIPHRVRIQTVRFIFCEKRRCEQKVFTRFVFAATRSVKTIITETTRLDSRLRRMRGRTVHSNRMARALLIRPADSFMLIARTYRTVPPPPPPPPPLLLCCCAAAVLHSLHD